MSFVRNLATSFGVFISLRCTRHWHYWSLEELLWKAISMDIPQISLSLRENSGTWVVIWCGVILVLKAVNTIHEDCIVHSFLKSPNFLLVNIVPKLIDFRYVKAIQSNITTIQWDSQVGTLNYMSLGTAQIWKYFIDISLWLSKFIGRGIFFSPCYGLKPRSTHIYKLDNEKVTTLSYIIIVMKLM